MSKVLLVETDKLYFKLLKELDGDSIQFRCLSPEKSLRTFIDYLQESHALTCIVDIEQVNLVEAILTHLERNLPLDRAFQLIVVSKASSWAKSVPSSGNLDLSQAFRRRAPTPSAQEIYPLESRIHALYQCNVRVKVVYIGQVYGGSGYDLQNIFKDIWDGTLSISSTVVEIHSKTVLGMIHVQRLQDMFRSLLQPLPSLTDEEEGGENELSKAFIVPAFDCCEVPFLQLISQCNAIINSSNTTETENTALSPSLSSILSNYDTDVTAFISALKNSTIFDQNSNLSLIWGKSWGEFLSINTLRPARILIASPPGYTSSRIENAKMLAARLQLPYVDVLSVVLFSLRLLVMSTSNLPPNVNHVKINDFKSLILSTFEAKLVEGTKKKDKNATSGLVTEGRLDESLVTATLCATIPIELQQKAIVLYSLLDTSCVRKGMILDCWEVEGLRDTEFFNTFANAFAADSVAPVADGNTAEVVADVQSVVRCPVDVVVELTCPDKFLLAQLQESYGAGFAKNKEGQAAYKSLEASLTAYTTSLVQYTAQETQAMTHPCIKAVLDKYNHHDSDDTSDILNCVLLQWDVSGSHEQLVEEIAGEVLHSRSDCLGWARPPPFSASDESPVVAAQSAASIEELSTESKQPEQQQRVDPAKVKGLDKYNEFLTSTILPVLAKGMIQAIRDDAYDPIKFLAEFMLQESAQRQQVAYEQAKIKFEDMVANN